MLYHLSEGSEIFPLDWLMALKSDKTGKPFLEDPERFGLIQDPEGLEVPGYGRVKLPIGLTVGVPRDVLAAAATLRPSSAADPLLAMNMVGVNCAACHVGRLRHNGNDLPIIEGAPNTFNIDSFYQELFQSAAETVRKADKLETFLSDLGRLPAKSQISRILVSSFVEIKKHPAQASSGVEKAIFKRIGELFEDAESGGKLDAPDAKKFISLISGRNLDAKAREELQKLILSFKRDLFESSAGANKENPLQALQQEGAVLPRVAELLKEPKSNDEGDILIQFLKAYGLLYSRLDFLRTLKTLHKGGEQLTTPGPGRIDAFGNARRLVFKNAPKIPLNSPASFPHLWSAAQHDWFHWDGNTNSFMERNIGQAMGVGAIADLETGASTILASNIHTLETFFSQLTPPQWPEGQFGAVDTASERYRKGATLYIQHCARCHDRQEGGQKSPDGSITYGLKQVGTDPLRASNFATPLDGAAPFTRELQAVVRKVKSHADIEADAGEHRGLSDLPDEQIRWLTTLGYVARPLEGIWATAPYLHNGSVPTLDDLLKPEDQRPICFPVGHREYDPVKLGYVSEFAKVPSAEHSRLFVYDTRIDGNSNRGHLYGTRLSANDREALLEYLKVMDPPDMLAQKPSRVRVEDVPAGEDSDIQELTKLQLEQMNLEAELKHAKPVERGQHPKHHGFVVARFTVPADVPEELRVGLFREPKTYTAVIRFSNTGEHDDRVIDNHGMAIKVLGVKQTGSTQKQQGAETHTQDFILLDHPQFFTPNVASLLAFSRKKKSLVLEKGLKGNDILKALNESFPKEVGLLVGRKKHIGSPLGEEYFSTTPYKLGETAVKYSAKPEQSKDYLREVMVEQLRPREQPASPSATRLPTARFGFYVQRQSDPSTMPIEDPTVEWKSAWDRVATIEIDAQDFDFPARWDWGNKLSFSPWHALDEHRPLGGINRARKIVYPASFNLRFQNLNAPKEATEADIPMKP
jgi:mono/diheme cytochrome c family protein